MIGSWGSMLGAQRDQLLPREGGHTNPEEVAGAVGHTPHEAADRMTTLLDQGHQDTDGMSQDPYCCRWHRLEEVLMSRTFVQGTSAMTCRQLHR